MPESRYAPELEEGVVVSDLCLVPRAFDHGLEGNLVLWEEALERVTGLLEAAEAGDNETLQLALADCRERCAEEVSRAEEELS